MIKEYVHNYTSTYARKQVKLDKKKHWYEHVPKSVETSQGGCGINKCRQNHPG
jgi:hypothetical protein